MKYSLILFALLALNCTTSQNSGLYEKYNHDDFLYWSMDRNLKWSDFQGKPVVSKDKLATEIFIYNPALIEKANLLSVPVLTAFCVFDKKKSWVNKELANDYWLLYNQVFFDIYELYTRKLREKFSLTKFGTTDYKDVFQKITAENNKALQIMIAQYQKETNLGNDFDATIMWGEKISSELIQLDNFKEK